MPDTEQPVRVFRYPGLRWKVTAIMTFFGIMFLGAYESPGKNAEALPTWGLFIFVPMVAGVLGFTGWRYGWTYVRCDDSGIEIRNARRTTRFAWGEISEFGFEGRLAVVRTRTGAAVGLAGYLNAPLLASPKPRPDSAAYPLIRDLTARLEAHRHDAVDTG